MMEKNWHCLSIQQIKKDLKTSEKGLTQIEAEKRILQYGSNQLKKEKGTSVLKLFIGQFLNLLIIILLVAVGISFFLGEAVEAYIILAIVFFSAVLGFIQEFRSQKALEALKKLASPEAHVIRDAMPQKIPSEKLVPGDLIILNWGDKVPADARIIEEMGLEVSEAVLTGESLPVIKLAKTLSNNKAILADRVNIVYSGTIITKGHGKAIVVETGMKTEFGKIASLISEVKTEKTPLEKKLEQVSRILAFGSLFVCAIATILGIWRGYPILQMFIWGVSLAVAAVPEALPAVVTGSLSLGVWEMAKKKAIVRRLPAVETLGSISVICSDKTGTLTRNEMTVKEIFVNNKNIYVEGAGYNPEGGFLLKKGDYHPQQEEEFKKLMQIALLCNDSSLVNKNRDWLIDGDPTEGALVVMAAKAKFKQKAWQDKYPRLGEVAFEMQRKAMSTIHDFKNGYQVLVKGAPESILAKCVYIQKNGEIQKLKNSEIKKILRQTNTMAKNALRVLAFAYKENKRSEINLNKKNLKSEDIEKDLVFVGLAGMIDPARDEAADAIKLCKSAGIKTIVITGDHALTTFSIGKDLGLFTHQDQIIIGEQLAKLSQNELLKIVDKKSYARVSPEDKLRIVKALKQKGYIVAMTGDGVNDAPALKQADIGIAMGIAGTDVAKEASSMILADDNFATIVTAIRKGREIYDNIKKYLFYLLRCNIGEILVLGGGFLFGLPPILSAIQILWINLATDGLPALALGVDPPDKEVMKRKPVNPSKSIFSSKSVILMFVLALNMGVVLLPQFAILIKSTALVRAQTLVFVTMVLMEVLNAYNSRSDNSLTKINIFENKWLNLAVLSSILATIAIVQIPKLSDVFKTTALTVNEWGLALVLSLSALLFSETTKLFINKKGLYNTRSLLK